MCSFFISTSCSTCVMDPEQAKAQQGLTFPQTQVVQQITPALATGLLGPAVQLAQPAAMEAQPGGATLLPAQDNRQGLPLSAV